MKIKIISCITITILLLSTCTSDVYNPDVCFQENVLPIFVSKCSTTGCHNSVDRKAGYDFSNYEGIMQGVSPKNPLLSKVYTEIDGNNPSMPPGQKLSQKEVTYIKLWIKMGAHYTFNCSSCDTTKYTYTARIKPIMESWCKGCHQPGNAGGGFDLSTYDGVVAAVANNKLLGALNHQAGYSPMPKNTGQLNACDLTAIGKWVSKGFPNN